ncbi:hypothetical protein CDL12_12747 [Handroanthus impetiginosus]|uniref:Uncharacterized protein n=1 Tax=Handroanthus impetiginosus TaxID=429701 RepID=A0A2G9HAS1_9LAMI|nr:hypothetical protein CDL12_12747 [Handroanthus impetiginosus]
MDRSDYDTQPQQALHKHGNHNTIILWTSDSISQLFMTFQNMLTKPRRTYQNPPRAQSTNLSLNMIMTMMQINI